MDNIINKLNFRFRIFNFWTVNRFEENEYNNIVILGFHKSFHIKYWNFELCWQREGFNLLSIEFHSNVWCKYDFQLSIFPIYFRIYKKH